MEQPLDLKIRNAYLAKDKNTSFARKEELWGRISGAKIKGVAVFWKIAAIFLGMLLFGGVFASLGILNKQKLKRQFLENKNIKLEQVVDSLLNVQPKIVTEIKLVETEKIIYKKVEVVKLKKDLVEKNDSVKVKEIEKLKSDFLQLTKQLELLNDSLLIARNNLRTSGSKNREPSKSSEYSFKLKPEKVQDQLKPDLLKSNHGFKLQLFNSQNDNIKYDTNSTLFRK